MIVVATASRSYEKYAAFGVCWYWLIDPEARSVEILKLGEDGRYIHALDSAERTIEVPGCEGLTLDLDALWRELDEEIEAEAPPSGGQSPHSGARESRDR